MLTITKTKPVAYPGPKRSSVSTMALFKNIPPADLPEIERNMIEGKYAKRQSIFLEKERAESVWFVKEGRVKEVHYSSNGSSNTICVAGADGMFGVSAFNGGDYGFRSVAETDATVISIRMRFFNGLIGKYPQLARGVLSKIAVLLRRSKDMQIYFKESVEKRILHVLVDRVGEFGNTIPLTRREIAEMAGTSVETCIRACVRLEKAGLITSAYSRITVTDANDLLDRMEEV